MSNPSWRPGCLPGVRQHTRPTQFCAERTNTGVFRTLVRPTRCGHQAQMRRTRRPAHRLLRTAACRLVPAQSLSETVAHTRGRAQKPGEREGREGQDASIVAWTLNEIIPCPMNAAACGKRQPSSPHFARMITLALQVLLNSAPQSGLPSMPSLPRVPEHHFGGSNHHIRLKLRPAAAQPLRAVFTFWLCPGTWRRAWPMRAH